MHNNKQFHEIKTLLPFALEGALTKGTQIYIMARERQPFYGLYSYVFKYFLHDSIFLNDIMFFAITAIRHMFLLHLHQLSPSECFETLLFQA